MEYGLTDVVVHAGRNMHNGHYYIFTFADDKW
jgi:uncharacterized UBP type Zn finger protein